MLCLNKNDVAAIAYRLNSYMLSRLSQGDDTSLAEANTVAFCQFLGENTLFTVYY